MTRVVLLALGLLLTGPAAGLAQIVQPRSADYLFTSTVDDVRSLWLNPAGLGVVVETSLMADLVFETPSGESARLAQWTVGFNARGISVGYQRDRLPSDSANQAVRFGLSRGFPGGALGLAVTHYTSTGSDQGWDVGLRYAPVASVGAAVVLRNIDRPFVRGEKTPLTAVMGLALGGAGGALQLATEALVSERIGESGYETAYRAGLRLSTPLPIPIAGFAATEFGSNLTIDRWTLGIAVGGYRRGLLVATLPSAEHGSNDLFSVHGVATNRGYLLSRR